MNNPFGVGMLDRLADRGKEAQPLADGQIIFVAVLSNRDSADQLHHEVRPPGLRSPSVDNPCNIRMVHDREGLTLRLEARDDLPSVHARLSDLHGHAAADWLHLFGHEHDPESTLADLLKQLVRPDLRACGLGEGLDTVSCVASRSQETALLVVRPQHFVEF